MKWLLLVLVIIVQETKYLTGMFIALPRGTHYTSIESEHRERHFQKRETSLSPVDIYSLHIESRIKYRYAHTVVSSRVANTANSSQELHFSVVLPDTAFISGFLMEIDGKVYKAFIKKKDEARKHYDQAVQSGISAAHIGVSARDSNHFTVSVNVEPRSKVNFNLTYEELLSRTLGVYSHVINLSPGQVVRDLQVDVYITESQPLSKLVVPELRSGNEVSSVEEAQNVFAVIDRPSQKKAHIHFAPSIDQQKTMSEEDGEGISGQFVVEYDVENNKPGGEILVNEGYFVHFFAPSDLPPLRKQGVFVLDVSGSMTGRKLQQLKQAMSKILDDLSPHDYFNIIEFSYSVTVWNLDSLSSSAVYQPELLPDSLWWYHKSDMSTTAAPSTTPAPQSLNVPSYPATPEYIRKAKDVINKMTAGGGTNIHGALKTALLAAHVGLLNLAANNTDNKSYTEDDKKVPPEPIIIFLTDGDATVGITKPTKILSTVKELNDKNVAIFSLAFGEGADLAFLRRLSLANNGFARNIYEASDAALQLKNFYNEVASPLLANVSFSYLPGQVENSSLTIHNFHTLFLGSQLTVAGKLKNADQISGLVSGVTATGPITIDLQSVRDVPDSIDDVSFEQEDMSEESVQSENNKSDKDKRKKKKKSVSTFERLWAYLTIKQLLDQKHVLEDEDFITSISENINDDVRANADEIKKKALDIALKYSFVTPLTSLVVIKPNKTSEVNTESLRPPHMNNRFYGGLMPAPHPGPLSQIEPASFDNLGIRTPPPFFLKPSLADRIDDVDKVQLALPILSLDDVQWGEDLVDTENSTIILPLGVNGTKQQYRLGINETNTEFQDCFSPMVNPSHCRHLPHCVLGEIITNITNYIRFFCPIPGGYAGICCPDEYYQKEEDTTTSSDVTTDTPIETSTVSS